MRQISILLHDIRSVHNVGSIFRTADAFGVSKIYISGYTPSPKDRFGRMRADIEKVALGAEKTVPWEVVGNSLSEAVSFVESLRKGGRGNDSMKIVALEQDEKSVSFEEARGKLSANSNTLLILGNEVEGVDRALLDIADIIVEIPMHGKKESLNVSVSAGIALFGLIS